MIKNLRNLRDGELTRKSTEFEQVQNLLITYDYFLDYSIYEMIFLERKIIVLMIYLICMFKLFLNKVKLKLNHNQQIFHQINIEIQMSN